MDREGVISGALMREWSVSWTETCSTLRTPWPAGKSSNGCKGVPATNLNFSGFLPVNTIPLELEPGADKREGYSF